MGACKEPPEDTTLRVSMGDDTANGCKALGFNSHEGAEAAPGGIEVAVVASAQAKVVKDALKARGWLAETCKPCSLEGGRIAFPLTSGCLGDLRAALAESGDLQQLHTVVALENLPIGALAHKKPTPSQKAPKSGKGGTATGRSGGSRGASAPKAKSKPQERSFGGGAAGRHPASTAGGLQPPAAHVPRVDCSGHSQDAGWLWEKVFSRREPVVMTGLDLGPCGSGGWSPERLASASCKAPLVSVHVCSSATVDLAGHRAPNTPRNFEFRTMPFPEAVARCAGSGRQADGTDSPLPSVEPLLAARERYYLRSVGVNPRRDAADMPSLFPELAEECSLLPTAGRGSDGTDFWLPDGAYHSSVLRLASDDTQLWTHFDVMDNVLAQLTGSKRVVLWPPGEDGHLYVEGSSSRVGDVDVYNDDEFPLFRRSLAARSECELAPGEALFLPALWFHNTTSIGFSVAVNVFWRSHPDAARVYDGKDLYGNRDPPAASAAMESAEAAAADLATLPQPFRDFYARRALRAISSVLSQPAGAAGPQEKASGGMLPCGGRVLLSSGAEMPRIGLGMYRVAREDAVQAITAAIAAGLRHIDCASIYGNEAEVGEALSRALCSGSVTRQELFVTSKLWNSDHSRAKEACLRSLRALRLDRLDLYLIHWPPRDDQALLDTWRQMEALVQEGLATSIGVSNMSARRLAVLLDDPVLVIPPAVNQVEAHPGWANTALIDACESRGVHVTAYSALGHGGDEESLLEAPVVLAASVRMGCTPAQALLLWAQSRGTSAIFKSSSPDRIRQNAGALLGPKTEEDLMELRMALAGLPQNRRVGGEGFVKPNAKGSHAFRSLAEIWD